MFSTNRYCGHPFRVRKCPPRAPRGQKVADATSAIPPRARQTATYRNPYSFARFCDRPSDAWGTLHSPRPLSPSTTKESPNDSFDQQVPPFEPRTPDLWGRQLTREASQWGLTIQAGQPRVCGRDRAQGNSNCDVASMFTRGEAEVDRNRCVGEGGQRLSKQ